MEEIDNYEWVAIEGFPDYYICREGLVKSCKVKEPIILKPHKSGKYGHLNIRMTDKDGNLKEIYLHRLLAQTFIPNPDNLPLVRHLNDIKDDNRLENLAWGDSKDNASDSIRNNTHISIKLRKPVIFIKDGIKYEYPLFNYWV